MRASNQSKIKELEFKISHLQQVATTTIRTEVLEQEKGNLGQDLEVSRARENNALGEIWLMLSWAQQAENKAAQAETQAKLAEERAAKAETELENALEWVTDLNLHSLGLEKTIKDLKEKITQEETSLPKQKRHWEQKWATTLWNSPNLNR